MAYEVEKRLIELVSGYFGLQILSIIALTCPAEHVEEMKDSLLSIGSKSIVFP